MGCLKTFLSIGQKTTGGGAYINSLISRFNLSLIAFLDIVLLKHWVPLSGLKYLIVRKLKERRLGVYHGTYIKKKILCFDLWCKLSLQLFLSYQNTLWMIFYKFIQLDCYWQNVNCVIYEILYVQKVLTHFI